MTDINTSDGALLEALNNKADVDLNNASPGQAFTSQSAGWAMPSDEYIQTSFIKSAVGSYTWVAPADGYFSFTGVCSTSGSTVVMYVDNIIVEKHSSAGHNFSLCWPFKKGKTVKVSVLTNALYAITTQTFFYAQGVI